MSLQLLRILDQVLGAILYLFVVPICVLVERFFPAKKKKTPDKIAILKLHGGGSLLVAMPSLLGIRTKYPQAHITLIGTAETKKFAELTSVFDTFVLIDSRSVFALLGTSLSALRSAYRHDVFIDLEPHSMLASVFTTMTLAERRIGFVKAKEMHRAQCYTTPIYFNLHAPIYQFYAQAASIIGAEPALVESCQTILKEKCEGVRTILTEDHPKPSIYIGAFTSNLSLERMMSPNLWVDQFYKRIGKTQPFTIIVGGSVKDTPLANTLVTKLKAALPLATILQTTGTRNLRESMADIAASDEFWGVDTGPVHIARLLGKRCVSFWGPTNPAYLLYEVPNLDEQVMYRAFPCSPCVHVAAQSPCKGDNQCMKKLFSDEIPSPITRL